ncbi:MAG: hypothetical protein RR346_03855, partial [Bacteroidales bacterium]
MNGYSNIDKTLAIWAENTLKRIRINFGTQYVYPVNPPYDGARKSTGKAYQSLYWAVHSAAGGSEFRVNFFFNYYLLFVDSGVGKGHPYRRVNDADLRYDTRYKVWPTRQNRSGRTVGNGRVSRPILNAEIRHQVRVLESILYKYYDIEVKLAILYGISNGLNPDGSIRFSINEAKLNERNMSRDAIRSYLEDEAY